MSAMTVERVPAYRISDLRFAYGSDASNLPAVTDMRCEIAQGEIVGLLGPNGSGKSTVLKLLAGLLMPQDGVVHIYDRPLAHLPPDELARAVAFVPQQQPAWFPFTIAEVVLMGRFPHHRARGGWLGFGWETREDLCQAEAAMEIMDVMHLAGRSIDDVSGGERQRALIARALAQAPAILLLDEPTAFLDLSHQVEICQALRRLHDDRGLTVVWASHDLNLASQYCDRLLLLDRGSVARIGTPAEVLRSDLITSVYGCPVLVDAHPVSGVPRVTLPGQAVSGAR
ncbi:MAG: ABC transporter ATP-binding protein [Nitrospira sp.]